MQNIECEECGVVLAAFESLGPSPIARDDCPKCGAVEFSFLE